MAGKKRSTVVEFSEADGRQLAVDMLREIQHEWEAHDLEGVADDDIGEAMLNLEPDTIRRYLAKVRERNSAALERGFLCVLTDYIGIAQMGSIEPAYFEAAVR